MGSIVNPLKIIRKPLPEVDLNPKNTCLLIVDMQYLYAHPDYGLVKMGREKGLEEVMDYYSKRLNLITLNIRNLLNKCREKKYEIIHTKSEALTPDGRDRSKIHKEDLLFYGKDSLDTEIIEELSPFPNEIVLPKTCSGVFNGTNIQQVLFNLGIKTLIVTGVATYACVDTAVRDAADRGFNVILVEDGCGAVTQDLHDATIEILSGGGYARIKSTKEVLNSL